MYLKAWFTCNYYLKIYINFHIFCKSYSFIFIKSLRINSLNNVRAENLCVLKVNLKIAKHNIYIEIDLYYESGIQ